MSDPFAAKIDLFGALRKKTHSAEIEKNAIIEAELCKSEIDRLFL